MKFDLSRLSPKRRKIAKLAVQAILVADKVESTIKEQIVEPITRPAHWVRPATVKQTGPLSPR